MTMEDDGSWMDDDETPFRIPAGKKLICYLLDEEVAAKLSGPLVVAAPDLLATLEIVCWVGAPDGGLVCPWCAARPADGHREYCPRQLAVAKAKGEGA